MKSTDPRASVAMEGRLVKYGDSSHSVAFLSASSRPHQVHLIMIGGLTDGLMACRYVPKLATELDTLGVQLVQPLLGSSHQGYGTASLDQDAAELHDLCVTLSSRFMSKGVILCGHSTGCQDACRYLLTSTTKDTSSSSSAPPVLGVILQAPVSDREFMSTCPGSANQLVEAREMVKSGRSEEFMSRSTMWDNAPMTARRFLSLYDVGGDDDMFSSDLSDQELRQKLGHMEGTPTLVLSSGADEFVPPHVDIAVLSERLRAALGSTAHCVVLTGADHACSEHTEKVIGVVSQFLRDHISVV